MADLPNGFTGFPRARKRDDDEFESAGEASRKLQEALASGEGVPGPSTKSPIADSVLGIHRGPDRGRDEKPFAPAHSKKPGESHVTGAFYSPKIGRHAASGPREQAGDSVSASESGAANAAPSETLSGLTADPIERAVLAEPESAPDPVEPLDPADERWAWLEIDLAAIRHNVAEVRRRLGSRTRLMAVVAADAYGHGAVECSQAMLGAGADQLAVATVSEGVELRRAGIEAPVVVLQQPPFASIPLLVQHHLAPAIYEPDFAVAFGEEADRHGLAAPYHLAVNTGMNRIGISHRDAVEFLHQVSFHRALVLAGTFTHFATADGNDPFDFEAAARRFDEAVDSIRAAGFDPGLVHAANSAAMLRYPQVHYDMVRCGIALYGIQPCDSLRERFDIRPAMSVHARITDARLVPMSEGVSFGYLYRSPGSVKVCTVPLGYADGLQQRLSGKVDFIVGGRYHRQVGAICMDQCMFEVDLRDRNNVGLDPQIGDHVLVVGEEGAAQVTVDYLAEKAHTIPPEILAGFGQRLGRVYK